jgi:Flp pilus assembly protein TadD
MRLGLVCIQQGKHEEAIQRLRRAVYLAEQSTETLAALATAHAAGGNIEEARTILNELEKPAGKRYVLPYNIAKIYSAAGNPDKAFECAGDSLQGR